MNQQENLIETEELIERAKKQGVDFGTGEPYNRLRYYTKMGWIPHMTRKGKNVKGHYPERVIERLKTIQKLKEKGLSNEEITEEIERVKKIKPLKNVITSPKFKKRVAVASGIILIAVLLLNEAGVIKLGASKEDLMPSQQLETSVFP
jgi:hypothetical protein